MLGVFRHALIFGLGPVLQKAASLVLLPLYTHHLSPADYGEIELLTLLTGLFVVIFGLEYRQGYIRALNQNGDSGEDGRVISVSVALFAVLSIVGSLCFVVILPFYCDVMLGYRIGVDYGAVLVAGLFADILNFLLVATAQARLWSGRMVSLSLTQFVFGTSLSVYLIVALDSGPVGLFAGNTIGSLLMTVVLLYLLRSDLDKPRRMRETVAPLLVYSYPLLIGAVVYFVLRQVDRVVISKFLSLDELGMYSMGWKLAGLLLTFMFLPFVRSFDVWRFRFYEEGGRTDDVARIFRIFMAGIAVVALALATYGADLFILLADERFENAAALLPILNAAVMVQCCYSVTSSAFYVSGETMMWLRILASGVVVQIVGSIVLVQAIGLYGAAVSMLGANLVIYLIAARYAPRYWDVPYPHAQILGLIGIVSVLSYLRTFWPRDDLQLSLVSNTALLVVFIGIVLAMGAIRVSEIRDLAPLAREKLQGLSSRILTALKQDR